MSQIFQNKEKIEGLSAKRMGFHSNNFWKTTKEVFKYSSKFVFISLHSMYY